MLCNGQHLRESMGDRPTDHNGEVPGLIYLPRDLDRAFSELAERRQVSRTRLIRDIIGQELRRAGGVAKAHVNSPAFKAPKPQPR
jgi:hypothetical protein